MSGTGQSDAGMTLSLHGRSKRRPDDPAPRPMLVTAFECSRPSALPCRHLLAGVDAVLLGRGTERKVERRRGESGAELAIRIPDRWMSSSHARIERSFGRWVLEDARSKNGSLVNGEPVQRAVLRDGDLVELGHTLFLFRDSLPVGDGEAPDLDLGAQPAGEPGMTTLVPALARQLEKLTRVAGSADISVLVHGESGTGKELLARAVHALSGRRGEFVAVNCGAIPDNLVESELFGHKKGAFSGADSERPGLIRAADGGTLFLDEIGDLPASSQAALLRVLQEREVLPVGGTRPIKVDIRLVAATHRDLDAMVASGEFRHDLYARVVGFRVDVPPLRERREDLGLLIATLLERRLGDLGDHPGFAVEAARTLYTYSWPLNVRELESCLQTASVLAGDEPIAPEHLPPAVRREKAASDAPAAEGASPPLSDEDRARRDELVAVLGRTGGNISAAARELGKDRKQIQRWVKRFGIDVESYR